VRPPSGRETHDSMAMSLHMPLSWFGVKTLFRTRAIGPPRAIDGAFDPGIVLIEERIVLFRASGFDDAITRAETEARRYAKTIHRNPYGQKVVTRYLESCDAFKLFDSPAAGVEVFSSTMLVPSTGRQAALVDRWFGALERRPDKRRRKFLNREFNGASRGASHASLQPTIRAQGKSKSRPRSRAARD
jgi:hypothetical protein